MNNRTESVFKPSRVQNRNRTFLTALRVLTISMALFIHSILLMNLISNAQGLVIFSLLLLGYILIEINSQWLSQNHLFWINPVVLGSIFIISIPFGISNFIFLLPENLLNSVGMNSIVTPWMNRLMMLVIFGAVAMWVGYSSRFGKWTGQILEKSKLLRKGLSTSVRLNKPVLYGCIFISLAARLLEIKLGIYGYSSIDERLVEAANYREMLLLAASLGRVALMAAAMQCFSSLRSQAADRHLLWITFGYEVAFGFLSGFKGAVVTPILIVGVVHFSQRNRFPLWLFPAVIVGVLSAYAVIEPFRELRKTNPNYSGTSVGNIATAMGSNSWIDSSRNNERAPTSLLFLARNNLTFIGSLGIEYKANRKIQKDSPKFLEDTLLAPAYALVPRFLWRTKSVGNTGQWYTTHVVGLDVFSSTAMSPFTYLNFAGGPLAVVLGFMLLGVVQRAVFDGLPRFGSGGMMMLLGLLSVLSLMEHSFSDFIVNFIRLFPMMFIAQYFLLQRQSDRQPQVKIAQ